MCLRHMLLKQFPCKNNFCRLFHFHHCTSGSVGYLTLIQRSLDLIQDKAYNNCIMARQDNGSLLYRLFGDTRFGAKHRIGRAPGDAHLIYDERSVRLKPSELRKRRGNLVLRQGWDEIMHSSKPLSQ